ncbi:MAG: CZB domain-containing protein [Polyangiales bacterium]
MDFKEAGEAHRNWKVRLRTFVHGGGEALDEATVRRDDACTLGKWLHTLEPGQRTGDVEEMFALHAKFHRHAAEVVAAARQGQREQALRMLDAGTPYADTSFRLIGMLGRLNG